jgi:cytochrome P450
MQRVRQSPTDPDFIRDPYAFYNRIRAMGPLVMWEDYGMACATDYATVNALLRDRRFGREPIEPIDIPDHLSDFYGVEAHSMLEREPPVHTRLRGQVLRAFTSRRIAALAPEITALCDTLIDRFPASGPFDLLDAYARPLPARIIARFLGVPEDSAPDLLRWSNGMVGMYKAGRTRADEIAANSAARDFAAFIRAQIDLKRQSPGDDLISTLITAQNGDRLSEPELVTTCILLLNAGHEATVHTTGNIVKYLLETGTPASDDPAFVEEATRYDPPLHLFTRTAYEPVTMAGHSFARGDKVALLLACANHDPKAFPDPARFDPTRTGPAPLSFGAGLHFCIGAPLARLELGLSLTRLMSRCPDLALVGAPAYGNIFHFRGLDRLMVRCG